MSQFFAIHSENPQPRLVRQAVRIVDDGGVIVFPTDSCYAIGCHLGDKTAVDRVRRIRDVGRDHNFTLVCRDLSEISTYARIDKSDYRLLKQLTPGPWTYHGHRLYFALCTTFSASAISRSRYFRASSSTPSARPSASGCPITRRPARCSRASASR